MGWIDTIAITIITLVGLGVFYKALKEPIDLFIGFIRRMIEGMIERAKGSGEDAVETITYG